MITLRLFLLFTGTLVKIIINADNKERTWSDANSECNLLGSHESGIFSEISAIYQDQVPTDGKMYWIAAIKKTTIPFRFNKCRSSVDVNTGIFNIQGTRRPVYDCFNNCSGDFFALSLLVARIRLTQPFLSQVIYILTLLYPPLEKWEVIEMCLHTNIYRKN
ncbi:uncharacterized protein LOC134249052 isoform X2 [Saccostrea cucullata]|uniref:uncharacterized protein LOC134249052 isoform X2 n=1 Tax=Saccostrea cuccullata TaxID=36930 RepID=UPI002ED622B6